MIEGSPLNAPIPQNESARLDALRQLCILDTPAEEAYDDLTRLAAFICDVPIALITLIDQDRQWFKSRIGLQSPETPRSISFCGHAILQDDLFIVPDALQDERFAANPLVLGDPNIRFYAGMPIAEPDGQNIGTLCVIDRQPRQMSEASRAALRVLARQVATLFQIRRQIEQLREAAERQATMEQRLRDHKERLQAVNRQLQEMVRTDALTGLGNRRLFDERLRQEWKLAQRLRLPLSLLTIDIDHFKRINDSIGHAAGDEVLRHLGALLNQSIRGSDTCARCGGEEFAVIMPATELSDAVRIADELRAIIASTPCGDIRLTVSIGVAATLPGEDADDMPLLARRADDALYRAKANGRNRVEAAVEQPSVL